MKIGDKDWRGWARVPYSASQLCADYSNSDFIHTLSHILSLANPPVTAKERRSIDGYDVLFEEPDLSSGAWTKIERLRGLYRGLDLLELNLRDIASHWFDEEATLLKDKINIKKPGRTGFGVHQDIESYRYFPPTRHLTAMVSLVDTTKENGCMYFAQDYLNNLSEDHIHIKIDESPLLNFVQTGASRGNLCHTVSARLQFADVATMQNEVLLFDSFVPHGSYDNLSISDRPALFLTFTPARFNYSYKEYYLEKAQR